MNAPARDTVTRELTRSLCFRRYSSVEAARYAVIFEVGGFAGLVAVGYATDALSARRHLPVVVACFVGAAILILGGSVADASPSVRRMGFVFLV